MIQSLQFFCVITAAAVICLAAGKQTFAQSTNQIEELLKSAKSGDASAQRRVGFCFLNGQGVTQDYSEAVKWFTLAAIQGDEIAKSSLTKARQASEERLSEEIAKTSRQIAGKSDSPVQTNVETKDPPKTSSGGKDRSGSAAQILDSLKLEWVVPGGAQINRVLIRVGDKVAVKTGVGDLKFNCVATTEKSLRIRVEGEKADRTLELSDGKFDPSLEIKIESRAIDKHSYSATDGITTRGGTFYRGAVVRSVNPDGVFIEFITDGGMTGLTSVTFENLPDSIQKQYAYDRQKVTARYQKEQAQFRINAARSQARQTAQENEKQTTVQTILSEYHRTHTYTLNDLFVCVDMACDVWNMVRTKGIKAEIWVGNIDRDTTSLREANHAWVIAEVNPGKWLALETTGGHVVHENENPRYYRGHSFTNPKEVKNFQSLLHQLNEAERKEAFAIDDYNQTSGQYNAGDAYTRSALRPHLDQVMGALKQRQNDLGEINRKLGALLRSGVVEGN